MIRRSGFVTSSTRNPLRESGVQHALLPDLPPLSSEELVRILVRGGGRVIARQEHGVMLEAERRLIFIRHTAIVDRAAVADAVRASGIGVARFREMLDEARGARDAS